MKCITRHCRNEKGFKRRLCYKCTQKKYKESQPYVFYYHQLKCRARKRGKYFALSLMEFISFCNESGYIQNGIRQKGLTIDRTDLRAGYEVGNIRVLTHIQNSINGNYEKQGKPCPF